MVMSFVTTIPVMFPCSQRKVFRALCDLESHPLWNIGMTSISTTEPMYQGLRYETTTVMPGGLPNVSQIEVIRLQEPNEIELISRSGAITYHARFALAGDAPDQTMVTCHLKFEFNAFVVNLTKTAIESMASARVRANLEALRALIDPVQPEN